MELGPLYGVLRGGKHECTGDTVNPRQFPHSELIRVPAAGSKGIGDHTFLFWVVTLEETLSS